MKLLITLERDETGMMNALRTVPWQGDFHRGAFL